jgi:NADH-quinone oxidoreductase subunit E
MDSDIDIILKRYKAGKREELIPLLQEIQSRTGYISEDAILRVGNFLGLSTTKIYGLATFYEKFRFFPQGKIRIKICHGTSCFLNGSEALISKVRDETGVQPGITTRDGLISYEIVSCMGGCIEGPVISVNDEFYTKVSASQIPELIKRLRYFIEND